MRKDQRAVGLAKRKRLVLLALLLLAVASAVLTYVASKAAWAIISVGYLAAVFSIVGWARRQEARERSGSERVIASSGENGSKP